MTASFATRANDDQREAITTTEGPLLIIAGPGSGKTFTLVERVVYLITQKNTQPENLMVVTFTEKAAHELITRISNRLHELDISFNLNEMYIGTFHAICLRWLENYREFTRLKRNFTMMDQFDQRYFLYQHHNDYDQIAGLGDLIGSRLSRWRKTKELMRVINLVSEEALDGAELTQAPDPLVVTLGHCHQLYQQQLASANAIDFSSIQLETLHLLRNHPQVLAELQAQIRYVMVDEYQDTNTIQEALLNTLLPDETPNLCVVGDDDQGLYRFRGATIRNILQFGQRYPLCHQVRLTINYRSHPDIIHFYNQWAARQNWTHQGQTFRYDKTILPQPKPDPPFPEGPTVARLGADDEQSWHEEVLAFLHALRDEGTLTDWNQVAFLFKSVKHERVQGLAHYLEEHGIPVYAPRSNQFMDREEIRLIIGAFLFLFPQYRQIRQWNPNITLDIWDYYDHHCFAPFADALRQPENADLRHWGANLARQHATLTSNTNYSFAGLFYQLLQFPLFSRYLDEERLKRGLQDTRPMQNLAIFSKLLSKFEYLHRIDVLTAKYLDHNINTLFNQFFRYVQEAGIDEEEDEAEYAPSGHVSFLTIHQSKGLEFPVVLVGSLYATPRKAYKPIDEQLETGGYLLRQPFEPLSKTKYYDFYRLYYTAFSRAQNILVLTDRHQEGRGRTPSAYFAEPYFFLPRWEELPLAQLPLEPVKDVNLKREYTFTGHIALYENCAEQYRFFKELDFAPVRTNPILFGTLVHETIEDIHKRVLRGQPDTLSEAQIEKWFRTNYTFLTQKERVYLNQRAQTLALEHVLRYYQRYRHDWSHIVQAEVDVSLVKESYILAGTVDLISDEQNRLILVDFKTEKKLDVNDPQDRDRLHRYRRQLEVYAHIVSQREGRTVDETRLYYTGHEDGLPFIPFDPKTSAISQTMHTFDEIVGRIEDKDFRISARPDKLCEDCDMKHYCDRKNWQFREKN